MIWHSKIWVPLHNYGKHAIFQRLIYESSPYTEVIWLPGEARSVPQGAIIGGHTLDGAPLYVIRAENHPGYYDARKQFAEYAYGAGSKTAQTFEYLVLIFCAYKWTFWFDLLYNIVEINTKDMNIYIGIYIYIYIYI